MEDLYSVETSREYEMAIEFLVGALLRSKNSTKPVLIHSIRVGLSLDERGYQKQLVMAALLHDILEDTAITPSQLKESFGSRVCSLVEAVTLDSKINDKTLRYKENFSRLVRIGKDALVVRAADIYDNLNYYHLVSPEERSWLINKVCYFLEIAEGKLAKEIMYQDLRRKFQRKRKEWNG